MPGLPPLPVPPDSTAEVDVVLRGAIVPAATLQWLRQSLRELIDPWGATAARLVVQGRGASHAPTSWSMQIAVILPGRFLALQVPATRTLEEVMVHAVDAVRREYGGQADCVW